MPIRNIRRVLTITFASLALNTNGLVSATHASLTDHENDMMEDGTFVYNTLSAIKKAALLKDFETMHSRVVIITRLLLPLG